MGSLCCAIVVDVRMERGTSLHCCLSCGKLAKEETARAWKQASCSILTPDSLRKGLRIAIAVGQQSPICFACPRYFVCSTRAV